ncbi:hypothetical protein [Variovorax sp. KK3]|uniref:hypothetical protein n=1 Tax=Variovorax sp. KK3 TaxID=1855728 RepID=UPI001180F66B|nr:hypothetical protein [Variovorax sp. KK3]
MTKLTFEARVFIKDALPRLYGDVKRTLLRDRPEMLEQLELLYLVERCKCGLDGCVSFVCESADARFTPINGRRPLSYPLGEVHGWYSLSDDGVFAGFEVLDDYDDGYLDSCLVEAGFGSNASGATPTTEDPSEVAKGKWDGSLPPIEPRSEDQEQKTSTNSVYMTAPAVQHLIEYRLAVQAYSREEIVDFTDAAMAANATPQATVVRGFRYPSLLSAAVHESTRRVFNLRMPLNKSKDGFEMRTVVPEGRFAPSRKG